jgi:hypothetical protein
MFIVRAMALVTVMMVVVVEDIRSQEEGAGTQGSPAEEAVAQPQLRRAVSLAS